MASAVRQCPNGCRSRDGAASAPCLRSADAGGCADSVIRRFGRHGAEHLRLAAGLKLLLQVVGERQQARLAQEPAVIQIPAGFPSGVSPTMEMFGYPATAAGVDAKL